MYPELNVSCWSNGADGDESGPRHQNKYDIDGKQKFGHKITKVLTYGVCHINSRKKHVEQTNIH